MKEKRSTLEKTGFVLIFLMAALQGFYAIYGYIDPVSFATLRGSELSSAADAQWVQIYASRTLFVSLIIGFLLYKRNYPVLIWAALFGVVMPVTDGVLAYEAMAPMKVVIKHVVTALYLIAVAFVLRAVINQNNAKL